MRARLSDLLSGGDYLSYAYSYPHKTAYRALAPPVSLRELWAAEDRRALFLYVHVPFCEQRCGFCNLFTQVQPGDGLAARYVSALELQAEVVREALGSTAFARVAIGGGTPSYLSVELLSRVFGVLRGFGASELPISIEVSPATLDEDKVAVLREHRVTRVSMGVQSLLPNETSGVQRRQRPEDVARTLRALAEVVPIRNVDLIYGLPDQTESTLRQSIDAVIALGANELYLYPLYVRPLTILGRRDGWDDVRRKLYRAGRDHLRELGWRQASMRMFSAPASPHEAIESRAMVYRCQDDGMIGLGPGARSYARALHYATPFAVSQRAVRERIAEWIAHPPEEHAFASHGVWLSEAERRRRYLILSLLDRGVVHAEYRRRFGSEVLMDFPELREVLDTELATTDTESLSLTALGTERADVLGDWLQSDDVVRARASWEAT